MVNKEIQQSSKSNEITKKNHVTKLKTKVFDLK